MPVYGSAVIGAGPAGVACLGELLRDQEPVVWFDEAFAGGTLSSFSRVPGNTKSKYFRAFFQRYGVVDGGRLGADDSFCEIGVAVGLLKELIGSLQRRCAWHARKVRLLEYSDGVWHIDSTWQARRVFLATGSHPREPLSAGVPSIPLEVAFDASLVRELDPRHVAVIGGSHSAILACKTLAEANIPFTNLRRNAQLQYAEYLPDGRIKHDDTGLKGAAAQWAREHHWPTILIHERVDLSADYSHAVWAIGIARRPLPIVLVADKEAQIGDYDDRGRLLDGDGVPIPQLFGYGVAFPRRVLDVSGEWAQSVGWFKFMTFLSERPYSLQ